MHGTDHTSELEQWLKAIHVGTEDSCTFFCRRDRTQVALRRCWYCVYGSFDFANPSPEQIGLCKFKQAKTKGL